MSGTVLDLVNAGVTRIVMPSEKAALPPVRSEPMLAPEHLRVWQDIVDMCKRGGWSSINVASKQRMAAIIAVDEALRANTGAVRPAVAGTHQPLVGHSGVSE